MDLEAIHDAEKSQRAFAKVIERARAATVEDVQSALLRQLNKEERAEEKGIDTLKADLLVSVEMQDRSDSVSSLDSDMTDASSNTLAVRWEFRKVLSYWSIVAYIIGCLMFSVGCIFAMLEEGNVESLIDEDARHKALVTYPFVTGSSCFFLGSYISWFRIINKKYKGKGVIYWGYVPSLAYLKASLYLFGGFFYVFQNYNKIAQNGIGDSTEYKWEVTFFLTIGSAMQLVGSLVDLNLNRIFECNVTDYYFWAAWGNVLGCLLFAIGSDAAWFTDDGDWVNVPYLIGSIFFALSSWVYLWVWKLEQWIYYYPFEPHGHVNMMQQLQLAFYNCSLALCICVFVFYLARGDQFDYFYCIIAMFGILFNVGLLQLANALMKLPDDGWWSGMLMYLRFLSILFFVAMICATINIYNECYWDTNESCS